MAPGLLAGPILTAAALLSGRGTGLTTLTKNFGERSLLSSRRARRLGAQPLPKRGEVEVYILIRS